MDRPKDGENVSSSESQEEKEIQEVEERESPMKHGKLLEVGCPKCKAAPFEHCRNKNGKSVARYHEARRSAVGMAISARPSHIDVPAIEQELLLALSKYIDRRIAVYMGHRLDVTIGGSNAGSKY